MKIFKSLYLFLFSGVLFAQSPDFDAKGILYFSDSDYNVESLKTGTITKKGIDYLGAFTFPLDFTDTQNPSEQPVSNSILDDHRMVAYNSSRKLAYVIESRSSLAKNSSDVPISELEQGAYVSVIDVSNLRSLKPLYRFPVGNNPSSISLDPANKYLAISSTREDDEIQIYELDQTGKPDRLLPKISHLGKGKVNDLEWHPSGNYLVFVKKESREAGIVKIVRDQNTIIRLEILGDNIKFEGTPVNALFSKDGNTLFVLDDGGGGQGKVYLIRPNFETEVNHALLARAEVGKSPKSLVLHPTANNLFVAGTDSETGLSVLYFTNNSIDTKMVYGLDGFLPSKVSFDRTGRNFVVSYFQSKSYGKPQGKIQFYTFKTGENPTIDPQKQFINIPVGIHYIQSLY